jgi:hypothetical protein
MVPSPAPEIDHVTLKLKTALGKGFASSQEFAASIGFL